MIDKKRQLDRFLHGKSIDRKSLADTIIEMRKIVKDLYKGLPTIDETFEDAMDELVNMDEKEFKKITKKYDES